MKLLIKVLTAILLIGTIIVVSSCGGKSTTVKSQTYTVARGNITNAITAAGNLAFLTVDDLSFELFYAEGTVSSVNVSVGDTVTTGEILASLDPTEWNDNLQILQDALTTANSTVATQQRALDLAQRQVVTQQQTITDAQNTAASKQYALQQAQLNLQTAQYNLSAIGAVQSIQNNINYDDYLLDYIAAQLLASLSPGADAADYGYWTNQNSFWSDNLTAAQKEMTSVLAGDNVDVTSTVALQVLNDELAVNNATLAVTTANQTLAEANTALNNAQDDLAYYQQSVTAAQLSLNVANEKLAEAQQSLDEANADSPYIASPIDGFVTQINVTAGTEVYKGAIILEVADPTQFEASILVSEMNINQVRVGGTATVSMDAIPGVTWSANITQIAPTATISSGVVNYAVEVQIGSIIPVVRAQSGNTTFPRGNAPSSGNTTSSSTLPPALQAAVNAGRITQQQAESFSGAFGSRSQIPASTQNIQLRQGMTATVNLIVSSRTNVIVVPNGAITSQGGQSYVQVIGAKGVLEKRTVQTGLSDTQNTEITSGLNVGDKVSVPLGTSTTTTSTTTPRIGGGGLFLGGR